MLAGLLHKLEHEGQAINCSGILKKQNGAQQKKCCLPKGFCRPKKF
jgi:hypothetical protein